LTCGVFRETVTRQYSRRATLGILGAGLTGLTGALTPTDCSFPSTDPNCEALLSLSGPDTTSLARGATDPRFVLANERDDTVRVADATWTVYREENGWEEVASDRSSGASATLAPGAETAWAVLVRAETDSYATSADANTRTSTTRYVGPVSLSPGPHVFVLSGRVDGGSFEVGARFVVE
jgi:hypothetical protein